MNDFCKQLNENQRQAVLYNEGPSLIIAGAGTGKTRVLIYKIVYLLKSDFSPSNLLVLTFTNKAAMEMKSRIVEMVGENIGNMLCIGTFHSVFCKILRKESKSVGFNSDFTIYDTYDSKNLIKTIVKEKNLDDRQKYTSTFIQAFISEAKNNLIMPEQYAEQKNPYLREICSDYQSRCKMSNAMDFDDLLLYTYLLFMENQQLLLHYRNKFKFILIDEYSDTNFAQHKIIHQLAMDSQQICAVGDDAQSIYSFRGANIENVLNFKQTYPRSKLFKLEQNYRSTKIIVKAANSLIEKNQKQIKKTIYSCKESGGKIRVFGASSDYEEGYVVVNHLSEMMMFYKYNYKDFVILYRTNAQSRIFEEALRKVNIPYRIYGGLSFFQRKEIKDIIAYFRLISNPNDEEALKRVINYPVRGIGIATVNKLLKISNSHNESLWTVLSNLECFQIKIKNQILNRIMNFKSFILSLRENAFALNAYDIGLMIIQKIKLIEILKKETIPENISCIQNIQELLNSLHAFVSSRIEENNPNIKLSDFLSEVSLITDHDTDNKKELDCVAMMTVHSSKGLEFKNVFVVGLEDNLFPSESRKYSSQGIEEERRLFYVAITRAMKNVILSYAKSRFCNGHIQYRSISPFLYDIEKQYLLFSSGYNSFYPGKFAISVKKNTYNNPSNRPKIGSTIKHEQFGKGKVIALTVENEKTKATVKFEQVGVKCLVLNFAKFEIIN